MDYKLITPDRFNDVLEHLRNSFYVDEILLKSQKVDNTDKLYSELDNNILKALKLNHNLSVMAISRDTNQICGVQLNGILRDGDIEEKLSKIDDCENEELIKVRKLIFNENFKLHLFQRFPCDRIFENRVLSVDRQWRGQGVAKKLKEKGFEIAKELGIEIIKADVTGLNSWHVSNSLGYETLAEVRYDEYLDEDGQPIFKVEPPNEKFVILYKRL